MDSPRDGAGRSQAAIDAVETLATGDYLPAEPRGMPGHHRYRALMENWKWSRRAIATLRDGLKDELPNGVQTVAIAGSFGRLEASQQSDADCIVVIDDDPAIDARAVSERAQAAITRRIAELGIPEPNPKGVFAKPRRFSELLPPEHEGKLGAADEEADVLGKRMLMLLESRPLYRDAEYERCVSEIFVRYAKYVREETTKEHLMLLNDLIRYFRSICINYQASFERENEMWPLRNLKLRHSRIVMYMGLLVLIGESSKYSDRNKLSYIRDRLGLTPLERIAAVYEANGDSSFYRVAGLYDIFVDRISQASLRDEINGLAYEDRYGSATFRTLKANSDALQAELTRFVLARQGQWSERFFEYLIF